MYNVRAQLQVQHSWHIIRNAPGYHKSFDDWLFAYGFHEIPVDFPQYELCVQIKDAFHNFYYRIEQDFRLYKSKMKQLQIIEDFRQGGMLAFREIKDAEWCPMSTVHFTNTVPIKKVRWSKQGTKFLPLAQTANLDSRFDIDFQGQKRKVVATHGCVVQLDEPVSLRSNDFMISQRCVTARPSEMLEQLEKSWQVFFKRDARCTPDDWYEADQLLHVLHDCPTMDYTRIEPQDLEKAIQGTKAKSARGSDGFSTMDLRKIPTNLWQLLCDIFHAIEKDGADWPQLWMLAKTLCLPKVSNPTTPFDVRPVTILSKTYRLWSRIRGKQIAIHLSSQVPATIGGPSKGISAEMIAMFSTVEIEHSLQNSSDLCGLVLDIVKCYNAVPRQPLLKALFQLGINPQIIQAFNNMLKNMERFFEISGFCGSSWKTDTGIVEGCSIAVSCMLAIGIWCDRHIAHVEPDASNIMFADNWAIFHHAADGLRNALQATVQFVDALKTQLSPSKSWLWATCNKLRNNLQNTYVHDVLVPVVLHAKDLGVDQRYAKKLTCPNRNKKVKKTIKKMQTIAKAKVPRGYKKQLTNCAGLAIRTYGIAVELVNHDDYKSLRSATASALLRAGAGTSPWLALNGHDVGLDPQFRDLLQALFAWKRFLQVFPAQRYKLHDLLVGRNIRGSPFTRLVTNLRDLGWTFSVTDCRYLTNGYITMSWVTTPKKVVKRVLAYSWSEFVAKKCSHRKHFDICSIDTNALDKVYRKADFQNKVFLDQMCIGRSYTNDEIVKWDPHNSGNCPLCNKPDSRMHRLFKCEHTKELRKQIPHVITFAAKQRDAFWYHGLLPLPDGLFKHLNFVAAYIPPLLAMHDDAQMAHLFVDGTAYFGTKPHWTMSGAAVIEAKIGTYKAKVLDRTMVPGVCQSSYHGELFAVYRALQMRWKVTIYCDCQAVVDTMMELLANHDNGQLCNSKMDTEIWQLILQQISLRPKGCVTIKKVHAHQNWQNLPMGLERWCAYYNDWADFHAKQSICIDQKEHFDWVVKMEKTEAKLRQTHEVFVNFVCDVARCFENTSCKPARTKCEGKTNFDIHDPLLTASTVGVSKSPNIDSDMFFAFPWGPQLLWRLVQWSQQLAWCPHGQCRCTADISATELFADFAVTMGSGMPVCLTTRKERKLDIHNKPFSRWELQDLNVQADMLGTMPLSVHTTTFVRVLKFLEKHGNLLQWPKQLNHRPKSIALIGLSTKQFGYSCRPKLASGDKAVLILREYFCGNGFTRRDMKAPLSIPTKPVPVPPHFDVPFDVRETYLRRGVHEFFTATEQ